MYVKTTIASLTATLAIAAAPAFADKPTTPGASHAAGKATAPGQICKAFSKKKTNHGKGQSPFAACVSGAKRAQAENAAKPGTHTPPAKLCKDKSHKKAATDRQSPFAACVSGAAKAQHAA